MNLALIPLLGPWGAAISFATAYLVFAWLSSVFGARFLEQDHDWLRIATAVALGVIAAVVFLVVYRIDTLLGTAIGIAIVFLPPIGLVATSLIAWSDVVAARRAIRLLLPSRG